ncbi:MAG: hypothetical protein KGI97_04615 [Alphaproteobacteria bacterium]|nr:hypothetical protein [Alphaproteobacteria bacterium]
MFGLNICFNMDDPKVAAQVTRGDFEEKLALRIIDIIHGRESGQGSDPAPYNDGMHTVRSIGVGSDFWLRRDDIGSYRLGSRHPAGDLFAAVDKILHADHWYGDMLLPSRSNAASLKNAQPAFPAP